MISSDIVVVICSISFQSWLVITGSNRTIHDMCVVVIMYSICKEVYCDEPIRLSTIL
jgi:hypothetical protein